PLEELHSQEAAAPVVKEDDVVVFAGLRMPDRLSVQEVLAETFVSLSEVQELHLLAVLADRMIDEFNDLVVLDPAVRVQHQAERSGTASRACRSRRDTDSPRWC